MRKTIIITIALTLGSGVSLAQNVMTRAQENARDSVAASNRGCAWKDSASRKSVVVNATEPTKMRKESVKTVRYDAFKEKMKDPWIGGLIKDIVFR